MQSKVILKTSGLKQGRKRAVDVDHAVMIMDLTRRGYSLNMASDRGVGSVSFTRKDDAINVTANDIPTTTDWVEKIVMLLRKTAPPQLHIIITNEGADNG